MAETRTFTLRFDDVMDAEIVSIMADVRENTKNKAILHVLSTYRKNQRMIAELRQELGKRENEYRQLKSAAAALIQSDEILKKRKEDLKDML